MSSHGVGVWAIESRPFSRAYLKSNHTMVTMGVLDAPSKRTELRRVFSSFGIIKDDAQRKEELEQLLRSVGIHDLSKPIFGVDTWADLLAAYMKCNTSYVAVCLDERLLICLTEALSEIAVANGIRFSITEALSAMEKLPEKTPDDEKERVEVMKKQIETICASFDDRLKTFADSAVPMEKRMEELRQWAICNPVVKGVLKYSLVKSQFHVSPAEIENLLADRKQWKVMVDFIVEQD